jgi:hypothetical protein
MRPSVSKRASSTSVQTDVQKEPMRHSTVPQSGKYHIDALHLPHAAAVASLPAPSVRVATGTISEPNVSLATDFGA